MFTFLSIKAHAQCKEAWVWIFGVTAVVYNPFIRIHFTREFWSIINIITIIIAVYSAFIIEDVSKR